MELIVAAGAQQVLGTLLFLLGRWGRRSADRLVPARFGPAEHQTRADGLALGGVVCQVIGVLLALFAIGTAIAAAVGVDPTFRPQ